MRIRVFDKLPILGPMIRDLVDWLISGRTTMTSAQNGVPGSSPLHVMSRRMQQPPSSAYGRASGLTRHASGLNLTDGTRPTSPAAGHTGRPFVDPLQILLADHGAMLL
jgi:hypothetical protein